MKILTAEEMGAADRRTEAEFGVPLESLMERAGRAVAEFCVREFAAVRVVAVLCGRGNNGGDGLVAARVLEQAGVMVRVVLLGGMEELKGEAAGALGRLRHEAPAVMIDEVVDEAGLQDCATALRDAGLLIDAVTGTGFKPPLRGIAVLLREMVERLDVPVVAVDLPTGWDANSMEQTAAGSFRADAVVTFTAPKLAHVFGHLTRNDKKGGTFGPVVVAGIGSPEEAVVSASGFTWTGSSKALAEKARDVNSNKGKFGHVLVVGGSYGKAGAPAMASLACLRTGAGLVTAAVPTRIAGYGCRDRAGADDGSAGGGEQGSRVVQEPRWSEAGHVDEKITVLAVGPGLSTEGDAPAFARHMVEKTTVPAVIDADALNAFEGKADLLKGKGRVMVLTPHPGEMARLAGLTVKEVEADRVGLARRFATEHKRDAGFERVADAGGASGWIDCGEYERESGDGEGRERGYFDGDRGGDACAVSGRREARGRDGGLSAWAGGGLCCNRDG